MPHSPLTVNTESHTAGMPKHYANASPREATTLQALSAGQQTGMFMNHLLAMSL